MYQRNFLIRVTFLLSGFGCVLGLSSFLAGQDENSEIARQVDYKKDIKPIIDLHCVMCHGPDEQEGEIDFEDFSTLEEIIERGNRGESTLYEVITTEDEDRMMPPPDSIEDGETTALSTSEIALIALWIDEGANFGEQPKSPDTVTKEAEHVALRVWRFSGWFHPAVVHFPIAFFLLGALFVIIFRRNMALANEASYYCLALGSLAAIFAAAFGWSLGMNMNHDAITDMNGELFWHRWSGVAVAALSVIVWFLAWRQRSEEYSDGGGSWKLGLILLAGIVGIVGHQGGELVYGENLYLKKLEKYLPEFYTSKKEATEGDAHSKTTEEQDKQATTDKGSEGISVDTANTKTGGDNLEQKTGGESEGKSAGDPVGSEKSEVDEPQKSTDDATDAPVESKSSDAEENEECQVGG